MPNGYGELVSDIADSLEPALAIVDRFTGSRAMSMGFLKELHGAGYSLISYEGLAALVRAGQSDE